MNKYNILNNLTNKEKFEVICRIKKFDKNKLAKSIFNIIKNSSLEEKDSYASCCYYEDEYGNCYDRECLYLDSYILDTFDDWAKSHMECYDITYEECQMCDYYLDVIGDEFNNEQREFINLALECKVNCIVI